MRTLAGKIVLITGATSGIGRATAFAFAAEGARLLLCARRLDVLLELEAPLMKAGAQSVLLFQLDVTVREKVEEAFASLPPEWTDIEVLVNNAGLSRGLAKLWEDDPSNWDEMIDTNIKGLLYVTRAVLPGMVARAHGHVINLGSTAGWQTYANGTVYCATKYAERSISAGLKLDLLGTPVRVTSIDPGMVETDFSRVRFGGDEERARKVYERITPLKPEDVADTIVWTACRPAHVNIHTVVMTSIDQGNSYFFNRHD
jgi:3-hydroxy acid dehydrogenase/malonic semialdehyde reductase